MALSSLAPGAATRLAMHLFTRPHGRPASRQQRDWLADGHRFALEANGRELAAWSWGDGPTVLLQHGWNGRAGHLGAFVQPLVAAGFSVVAYDAPAHGRSPGRNTNMAEWSAILSAISHRLLGLHAIVAHSIGGMAAAHAAARGARIERFVFLSPPSDIVTFSQLFVDALGFSPDVHESMWRRWEQQLGIDRREFAIEANAAERRQPLLVVHDADDRDVPFAHGEHAAAAWPGAELMRTEGLGHHRIRYAPAVIERVLGFLGAERALRDGRACSGDLA